jgi:hypothetical protein
MISHTGEPSCIAARRADVRSLAMPVPAGTMNRTCYLISHINRSREQFSSKRDRLRTTTEKVYAFAS